MVLENAVTLHRQNNTEFNQIEFKKLKIIVGTTERKGNSRELPFFITYNSVFLSLFFGYIIKNN